MAKTNAEKTLADYVAIAIGPVLIMALVGSLVFFLLEVAYVGQFGGRLRWILFFFVFGAVLIARISMQGEIADRAGLYGAVLGLLVWVGMLVYVEYPPGTRFAEFGWAINLALIAVTWWSAHKLTWDCTLIDDSVDASGAGLLEEAGLERSAEPQAPPEEAKRKKKGPGGVAGWWERYRKYREERARRPHAPGVWVVYFSLAALPLFGVGQMLISAAEGRSEAERAASHSYAFFLMTIYVGSGLGLLLTTSFLGLRRYLRQRNLRMPLAVTGVWLTFGGLLIAGLLVLGAFLPRPTAEYRGLLEWVGLTSPDRKASEHAPEGEGGGDDEGTGGAEKGKGKGKSGRGRDKGKDGEGQEKGEKGGSGGEGREGKDGKGKGGRGGKEAKSGKEGGGRKGERQAEEGAKDASRPPDLGKLGTALKWIVGIVVALFVLFLLLRSGLRWLANFTSWARRLLDALRAFWASLWGGRGGAVADAGEAPRRKPRPFASFRDPFATGEAGGLSEESLVRYSFEALEAWGEERDVARQVGETPLEYARRVGGEFPVLEGDAARLADLYASLAYAGDGLPAGGRKALRQFWQVLTDAAERPLSAGVGSA